MAPEDKDDGETGEDVVTAVKVEETGPYFLRTLIDKVQLSADGSDSDVSITCVELWGECYEVGSMQYRLLRCILFLPSRWNPDS